VNGQGTPQWVVIVGAGFAGFECARRVCRLLRHQSPGVQVSLIFPEDYLLYTPLLPDVAGGVLDPRAIAVPLAESLPGVHLIPGLVDTVDLVGHRLQVSDPGGGSQTVGWDRLVLTPGSMTRLFDVSGVREGVRRAAAQRGPSRLDAVRLHFSSPLVSFQLSEATRLRTATSWLGRAVIGVRSGGGQGDPGSGPTGVVGRAASPRPGQRWHGRARRRGPARRAAPIAGRSRGHRRQRRLLRPPVQAERWVSRCPPTCAGSSSPSSTPVSRGADRQPGQQGGDCPTGTRWGRNRSGFRREATSQPRWKGSITREWLVGSSC